MKKKEVNTEELKKKPVSKLNLSEALESNRYEEFYAYTLKGLNQLLKHP